MTRTCALVVLAAACSGGDPIDAGDPQVAEGDCQIAGDAPDDLATITCKDDFDKLASLPIDATLPSATSMKLVLDRADSSHLYFQNTQKYQIHYQFCSAHLSGNGLPIVPDLATFNTTEYFTPDRRFVLGAITYYALPDQWALELSPYDTATADMITELFDKASNRGYFGQKLAFHPTSEALAAVAATLPTRIPIVTTDELYQGIDYQPLSLGAGVGTLHFTTVAQLAAGEYTSPYMVLVLDFAPNDLSVVQGTITREFQTPLSHINVLAHTRHSPNMGLRGALTDPRLLAYQDQLVKLTTTAEGWTVEPISLADAQAWWDSHAPAPVTLPTPDLTVTALTDVEAITPETTGSLTLLGNIEKAITAFGGKAAHYSILARTPGVPLRKAFAVPIYYYDKFMRDRGFYDRVTAMLADPQFVSDTATRDARLAQLRADIVAAPMDQAFADALAAKVAADYPAVEKLRFRSSSNSEDLSGFPCAGCYNSFSGKTSDISSMLTAIKQVYASAWELRTFDLRSYYRVPHSSVGVALVCHQMFKDEAANGVAVTSNPYDAAGLDPAFYANVQAGGDVEVVNPPPGTQSDQFLYYFSLPNQPIAFLAHSNIIERGKSVLSTAQTYELGRALDAIHQRFSPAYGPGAGNAGWYAMDVEFKFTDEDQPGAPPHLEVKQARWYASPNGGSE
jgi:hypothetical protein